MLREEQEIALKQVEGQNAENQQKRYFARFDSFLDNPQNGPYWLSESTIANIVKEGLHFRSQTDFDLVTYCLMSNHIHFVIDTREKGKPDKPLFRTIQSFKRYTARQANKVLDRTGDFWHRESYDHIVRDDAELGRIIRYVLQNPVKAGLVENWQHWPHSYVNEAYWVDV